MGRRCVVPMCKSGYDSCPEKVSMFSIPKNKLEVWQNAIGRKDRPLTLRDAVCEKHFRKKDIIRMVKTKIYTYKLLTPKLAENAIPLIFPTCSKYEFRPQGALTRKKFFGNGLVKLNSADIKFMKKQAVELKERLRVTSKEAFMKNLKKDRKQCVDSRITLSKRMYDKLILEISQMQETSRDILKKYCIVEIDGIKKLMCPTRKAKRNMQFYIHDGELYDILKNAHLALNHGSESIMMAELQKTYKNVCFNDIHLFVSLCPHCSNSKMKLDKIKKVRKVKKTKIEYYTELSSSCLLSIVDYQGNTDDEFNFILVYQNEVTKYYILKPLKSKTSEEIYTVLIDIFAFIGPPTLIQSEVDGDLMEDTIAKIKKLWPLQITHIKSEDNQITAFTNEIREHLDNWLEHNNTSKWFMGLQFVQIFLNNSHHKDIKKAPYDALFRVPAGHDEEENGEIRCKNETVDEENNGQKSKANENPIKEEQIDIFSCICEQCGNDIGDAEICSICQHNNTIIRSEKISYQ